MTMLFPRENPLLRDFTVPPFGEISEREFEPAIMDAMEMHKDEIAEILGNHHRPSFSNTIEPFTMSDLTLDKAVSTFFNLYAAASTPGMETLAARLAPLLSAHEDSIMHNSKLFSRIRFVYTHFPKRITPEQGRLLEVTYNDFVRSGALLKGRDKQRFGDISRRLAELSVKFSTNLLHARGEYYLNVTDPESVKGVPASALADAEKHARDNGREGWDITLEEPVYFPFMTYCPDREIRRKLYTARGSVCLGGTKYDNLPVSEEIVNLRLEKANLLGYDSYADFVLRRRIAGNKENVMRLLQEIIHAYLPVARREVAAVTEFARREQGPDFTLMPWDYAYYSRLLKLSLYHIDDEQMRPYFELSRVERGIFGLAGQLYGIRFTPAPDVAVYAPDVKAYRVDDSDGSMLGILLVDYFPRKGKQGGAWTTEYCPQYMQDGRDVRPVVSIVTNFTRPTAGQPSLLTFGEVTTFLHEFGHSLHALFSRVSYPRLSGTNVYRDFVEMPSQIMENFAYEKKFLLTFAKHYITGQPMPDELIDRIRKSRHFNAGYSAIRQVGFALIDMSLHSITTPLRGNLMQVEKDCLRDIALMPEVEGTGPTVHFSHIMDGGYAAGYYSYKWSEMLDADAYEEFQKDGVFSPAVASRFRSDILERGGSEAPEKLYERFRGHQATPEAMMRRDGILPERTN